MEYLQNFVKSALTFVRKEIALKSGLKADH